jgi:hypothetical protein
MDGSRFDATYFATGCGLPYERNAHWLGFFGGIADRIVRGINPRTALDASCAMGFLVEALRERGVEAYGVDISEYAISQVHPSVKPYCRLGSITEPFERRYDLIVCIEVLEHMPAAKGEQAIANFAAHTDDVLFSSTPHDFTEATHDNVQPVEHWASASRCMACSTTSTSTLLSSRRGRCASGAMARFGPIAWFAHTNGCWLGRGRKIVNCGRRCSN